MQGLDPSPLRLSPLEGEQTSLPCPINVTSMEPVSVVWYRVADVKFNLTSYRPQSVDDRVAPKKVYALVAPEPPVANHDLKLSWRRNGQPLSSNVATVTTTPSGSRENHLNLGPLFREDLFSNVSCVATSEVTLPTTTSVLIDMFLPPVEVSVWSWPLENADTSGWLMVNHSATRTASSVLASTSARDTKDGGSGTFSVGAIQSANADSSSASTFSSPRSFECEATGSRPPANITWFLDRLPLDERLSHTRVEGNVTASVLLLPSSEPSGKLLECRASNDNLGEHRGVLSRYMAVNVSNKPQVSINLGAGLNASHITEGTDVYMECSVLVTSRITDVTWSRDGRELDADLARGTVITSRYLVLRRVTPDHAGSYQCRVTNTRGDTVQSMPLQIRVRYSPRCVSDEDLTLSVETDAAVNLTCHVRADPNEGLRYFWLAESSTHGTESTQGSPPNGHQQLPLPLVTESNRMEIVANASIFDTALSCWAENAVGTQERRCRFTFVRKGVNTPTLRCSVSNYTDNSFTLTCFTPLVNVTTTSAAKLRQQQRLRVQVFDVTRGNRSERSFWSTDLGPILVNRLRSATDYLVVVQMPPEASFRTYARTLGMAQTVGQGDVQRNTRGGRWTLALSVVVLACSLAVTLTALLAIYFVHVRRKRMKKRRKPPDKDCKSDTSSTRREDVGYAHIRDHKEYLAATDSC
ncbi:hypothetical protein MTO96_022460 [Rhipicephalus appendiculatus]